MRAVCAVCVFAFVCVCQFTKDTSSDVDHLQSMWETAVTIAMDRVEHRTNEVCHFHSLTLLPYPILC